MELLSGPKMERKLRIRWDKGLGKLSMQRTKMLKLTQNASGKSGEKKRR